MKRQGFLLSIFVLLFLVPLVLLLLAYNQWFDSLREDVSLGLSSASSLHYVFDDIATDFLQMYDLEDFQVQRSGGNVTVSFAGAFNSSKNYSSFLIPYKDFIEGNYSQSIHKTVVLDGLAYDYSIPEYGMSPTAVGSGSTGNLYFYTINISQLKQINVTLFIRNQSKPSSSSAPKETAGGDTLVEVTMLDSEGSQILHEQRILLASDANKPFESKFTQGSIVDVSFEQLSGSPGVLWFDYDYNITILALDFVYMDINKTIHLNFNATATVSDSSENFSRKSIVGFEG